LIKFFLFFITAIWAYSYETITINNSFKQISSKDFIYYIEDITLNLSPTDVLNSSHLKLTNNTNNRISQKPIWTRISIKNHSSTVQNLFFSNPLAGTNYVDVYIYKNGLLVKKHILGDMRSQKKREIKSSSSTFNLTLLKDEHFTIVSRIENYQVYNIDWNIQNTNTFMTRESNKFLVLGVFAGLTFLIIVYNIFLFKIYNNYGYILLALQSFVLIVYQFCLHGLLYRLDLGINLATITAMTWTLSHLAMVFLILFQERLFNFKNKYPKLSIFSKLLASVSILLIIMLLLAAYINEELFKMNTYIILLIIFIIFYLFIVGIYMFIKKETGATYYMCGQGIFLIAALIHIFGLYKFMPNPEFFKYILPMGTIIDSLFLLISQYLYTSKIQKNLLNNEQIIMDESKSLFIGRTLENIGHQWKNPLTKIGTSITMLEATLKHDPKKMIPEFTRQLPSFTYSIELMKKTLDEFTLYNKRKTKKIEFSLKETIDNTVSILNSKITLKNVTVTVDIDKNIVFNKHEHIYSNIIMVLLDNSLEAFDVNSKYTKLVTISLLTSKEKYVLTFKDTAGGIKQKPIEKIFDYYESTKFNQEKSGIGLSIIKLLINNELNGEISVQNIEEGACFKIIIP